MKLAQLIVICLGLSCALQTVAHQRHSAKYMDSALVPKVEHWHYPKSSLVTILSSESAQPATKPSDKVFDTDLRALFIYDTVVDETNIDYWIERRSAQLNDVFTKQHVGFTFSVGGIYKLNELTIKRFNQEFDNDGSYGANTMDIIRNSSFSASIEALRRRTQSDIVYIVYEDNNARGGIGSYTIKTFEHSLNKLRTPDRLENSAALSIDALKSEYDFTRVFAHEIGHSFGLRHDRYVAPDDPEYFTGHGLVDVEDNIRTIMAYPNECQETTGNYCDAIRWFSDSENVNPDFNKILGRSKAHPDAADSVDTLKTSLPYYSQSDQGFKPDPLLVEKLDIHQFRLSWEFVANADAYFLTTDVCTDIAWTDLVPHILESQKIDNQVNEIVVEVEENATAFCLYAYKSINGFDTVFLHALHSSFADGLNDIGVSPETVNVLTLDNKTRFLLDLRNLRHVSNDSIHIVPIYDMNMRSKETDDGFDYTPDNGYDYYTYINALITEHVYDVEVQGSGQFRTIDIQLKKRLTEIAEYFPDRFKGWFITYQSYFYPGTLSAMIFGGNDVHHNYFFVHYDDGLRGIQAPAYDNAKKEYAHDSIQELSFVYFTSVQEVPDIDILISSHPDSEVFILESSVEEKFYAYKHEFKIQLRLPEI